MPTLSLYRGPLVYHPSLKYLIHDVQIEILEEFILSKPKNQGSATQLK
jgi:hypothetical protein